MGVVIRLSAWARAGYCFNRRAGATIRRIRCARAPGYGGILMDGIGSVPYMMRGGETPVRYHPSPEKKYRKVPSRQAAFLGLVSFLVVACLVGCGSVGTTSSTPVSSSTGTRQAACAPKQVARCHLKLLVFSKTGSFRHASIPAAIAALRMLAASRGRFHRLQAAPRWPPGRWHRQWVARHLDG